MSDTSVPLSVLSGNNAAKPWAEIVIGKSILSQAPAQRAYWIVILDRSTLAVVYNQLHADASKAPDIGKFNTSDYILIVATAAMGLDRQPQGAFHTFLDANGAGRELRRVEQIAVQLNCGSLGTFGYALVSVMGQPRGFEACEIGAGRAIAPILTLQLMPVTANGKTIYTPVQLSDA
jgi:hypothetical protein